MNKTKKKTLYLFDEKYDIRKSKELAEDIKSGYVYVCPISVCSDENAVPGPHEHNRRIDFIRKFRDNSYLYRKEFVDFIHDYSTEKIFNGKNIRQLFKLPGQNTSAWWFSLVAEKSTVKTGSYANLIRLITIAGIISENGIEKIILDIDNSDLASAVKENFKGLEISSVKKRTQKRSVKKVLSAFVYLASLILKKISVTVFMPGKRKRIARTLESEFAIVTYFPYFDKDEYSEGRYINRYYKPLQRSLKAEDSRYSWYAINCCIDGYSWKEGMSIGKNINNMNETLIFAEEYISFFDIARIALNSLLISIKYITNLKKIKNAFVFGDQRLKIWHLFAGEFYSSFLGNMLIEGMYYYYSLKKMTHHLSGKCKILYYMENQAWEKALISAAGDGKNPVKTIGIQHSSVPLLLLSHFENSDDLTGCDHVNKLPRPDYLACVGRTTMDLFKKQGWPSDELFILGGLRYKYLSDLMRNNVPWESKKNEIIVALTIDPHESREILYYICSAFSGKSREYKILIKNHYAGRPIEKLIKGLACGAGERAFEIVDSPVSDLLKGAKILITAGSTTAIEALACGCRVIIPELSVLDVCPLTGFTDLGKFVSSPVQLRDEAEKIIISKDNMHNFDKCKTFVSDYFEVLKNDEEYLQRIRAKTGGVKI